MSDKSENICKGGVDRKDRKTWRCLGEKCTVGDWTSCRRTIAKSGYKIKIVDE